MLEQCENNVSNQGILGGHDLLGNAQDDENQVICLVNCRDSLFTEDFFSLENNLTVFIIGWFDKLGRFRCPSRRNTYYRRMVSWQNRSGYSKNTSFGTQR